MIKVKRRQQEPVEMKTTATTTITNITYIENKFVHGNARDPSPVFDFN